MVFHSEGKKIKFKQFSIHKKIKLNLILFDKFSIHKKKNYLLSSKFFIRFFVKKKKIEFSEFFYEWVWIKRLFTDDWS